MNNQRNQIIDMMKGIAILFILVGHTGISPEGFLFKFLFSFHVPIFFVLAGYTAKSTEESHLTHIQMLWKDFKRLIFPYVMTALAILSFTALRAITKNDITILIDRAFSLYYVTYDAGPIWFLVTLFWCRVIFRPIMYFKRWSLPFSILLSGMAIIYAHHISQLPFCILTALAAMVFYSIGWWHKKYNFPAWSIVICLLCWPIVLCAPHIDLYGMKYGIYPITILGACGGMIFIFYVCKLLYDYSFRRARFAKIICAILGWVGMNYLIIICFHTFDIHCCWVTMFLSGVCGIDLSYWTTVFIRDGLVLCFSWIYVTYLRPLVNEHIIKMNVK